jgi:hypothetical protein
MDRGNKSMQVQAVSVPPNFSKLIAHRSFQDLVLSGDVANPHISSNTFLLIDSNVVESFAGIDSSNPWIWASEANCVPSPSFATISDGKNYEERPKVAIYSLRGFILHEKKRSTVWSTLGKDSEATWLSLICWN